MPRDGLSIARRKPLNRNIVDHALTAGASVVIMIGTVTEIRNAFSVMHIRFTARGAVFAIIRYLAGRVLSLFDGTQRPRWM